MSLRIVWASTIAVASAGAVLLGGIAARAQDRTVMGPYQLVQQPPAEQLPAPQGQAPAPAAPAPDTAVAQNQPAQSNPQAAPTAPNVAPEFLGDALPIIVKAASFTPHVMLLQARALKVAEDESPMPECRAYVSFNYYDDLNPNLNHALGLGNEHLYQETFGLEKAFLNDTFSIGLRLPFDTLSTGPGPADDQGTSTDVGDLAVLFKFVLARNLQTGSGVSAGIDVTTPTGPNNFAGSKLLTGPNSTSLQPFLGYLWNGRAFYVEGFSSCDWPTDPSEATLLYNDIGAGCWLYRSCDPHARISGVAPDVEAHFTLPLNHHGILSPNFDVGFPDVVDITAGAEIEFCHRARLALGAATPVTGPKPFDIEGLVQFRFGF